MATDSHGTLILQKDVLSVGQAKLTLLKTKFTKVKQIRCYDEIVAAVVQHQDEGKLVLWAKQDMMISKDLDEVKPQVILKCGIGRLTCLNL